MSRTIEIETFKPFTGWTKEGDVVEVRKEDWDEAKPYLGKIFRTYVNGEPTEDWSIEWDMVLKRAKRMCQRYS